MSIPAQTVVALAVHKLQQEHSQRTVEFTEEACSVIAVDRDYHRTRKGLMIYSRLYLCMFGDKRVILALGYKGGSYPGDEYHSDLMATHLDDSLWSNLLAERDISTSKLREVASRVETSNDSFRSSILTVMSDGRLYIRHEALRERVESQQERFIIEKKERRAIIAFTGGGQATLGFACTFRPEFSDFLATEIGEHLSKT